MNTLIFYSEYFLWALLCVALLVGFLAFLLVQSPENDDENGLPFHPPWERK